MLTSPIQIEQKPTGDIVLAHGGRRHEVASVASALRLLETMLTSTRAPEGRDGARTPTQERSDTVKALAGKYRDVLTPTRVREAGKRDEVELEERKLSARDV